MQKINPRPFVLIILDGWGHREETKFNAIAAANKPNWDYFLKHYPHTIISGSGRCVGLPDGQMGNSEVGHLNMGAGRIVHQDLTRIDLAIENGEFFQNKIIQNAFDVANKNNKAIHVMQLLSPGGVHSHEKQLHALLAFAKRAQVKKLYIHAFLDGRDTPPQSAMDSLIKLQSVCEKETGNIVSLIGRYYAMDRDKRWERIQNAYDLLTQGKADFHAETAEKALQLAYDRGETDEFVQATSIHADHEAPIKIEDGDAVIFMNFRADRAREITEAMTNKHFDAFPRQQFPRLAQFICLSEYDSRFALPVAFPPIALNRIFAECISELNLKQLRIAETEKYAHVTFFFNGGLEKPFPLEDRILIPSPKVATYDLLPEMSAPALTKRLIQEIKTAKYDVIICNFANPDMVGHSGDFEATVKAIEAVDVCLGEVYHAVKEAQGEILITADHGNAEKMFDETTQQPHTAHTTDPIPLVYIGRNALISNKNGKLSDISPTMLYLLNIPKPQEMTGISLVKLV